MTLASGVTISDNTVEEDDVEKLSVLMTFKDNTSVVASLRVVLSSSSVIIPEASPKNVELLGTMFNLVTVED